MNNHGFALNVEKFLKNTNIRIRLAKIVSFTMKKSVLMVGKAGEKRFVEIFRKEIRDVFCYRVMYWIYCRKHCWSCLNGFDGFSKYGIKKKGERR